VVFEAILYPINSKKVDKAYLANQKRL